MQNEQNKRIAEFLSEYLTCADGSPITAETDEAVLRDGVGVLIDEKIFTADALKREAARGYNVIIPYDWFGGRG